MKRIAGFFWREKMLTLSLLAAAVALTITPFTPARQMQIDWRTLGNLMMMLCVLEGVKQENLLRPVEALAARLKTMPALAIFLIFGVFFSSMFVTNDVSLIIFVPLTIQLFRQGGKERYLLPVISVMREVALFTLLVPYARYLLTTMLFSFNETGYAQYGSAVTLLIILIIILINFVTNKLTGASFDKGIGG